VFGAVGHDSVVVVCGFVAVRVELPSPFPLRHGVVLS
jgi:hypothetical protein